MKPSKSFLTALMATMVIGSTAAQAHPWAGTYTGVDENNNSCHVLVADYDQWVSIKLKSVSGTIDDNIVTPLTATSTQDGECSFLAGMGEDTTIVSDNIVLQRRRSIEFVNNWIQEIQVRFDKKKITDVQFRVSEVRSTGPGACSALRKNKLQAKLSCFNLQKM